MSQLAYAEQRVAAIPRDPRKVKSVPASKLTIDKRTQRGLDGDRCEGVGNEWDWERAEAITVTDNLDGTYSVEEGQHRAHAVKMHDAKSGADTALVCLVLPPKSPQARAQLALEITRGRVGHSALELWNLRLHAGHEHEVAATRALHARRLRVGRSTSSLTIGAVATVRSIVHGGNHSPEHGAQLLGDTVDVISAAFPVHDPESSVSRWERSMLLAVAEIVNRNPDVDRSRLVAALRLRPAPQWVQLGRGTGSEEPPHRAIAGKLIGQYNKGLRRGRASW